jgi:hypothetical protein
MNFINLLRQKPIVVIDYCGNLADGFSVYDEIPCLGLTLCYGFVYSDRALTLTINQGVNDKAGALAYRDPQVFAISAGVARTLEIPIVGKFLRATLANASGGVAALETLFQARGFG